MFVVSFQVASTSLLVGVVCFYSIFRSNASRNEKNAFIWGKNGEILQYEKRKGRLPTKYGLRFDTVVKSCRMCVIQMWLIKCISVAGCFSFCQFFLSFLAITLSISFRVVFCLASFNHTSIRSKMYLKNVWMTLTVWTAKQSVDSVRLSI